MVKNWSEIESFIVRILAIRKTPVDIFKLNVGKKNRPLLIFGSGSSINSITKVEWDFIQENYDTLGFNHFYNCRNISLDYYLIREFESYRFFRHFSTIFNVRKLLVLRSVFLEQRFRQTKFIFRFDRKAGMSILLYLMMRSKIGVLCSYQNDLDYSKYAECEIGKIPHGVGTLVDALHIGKMLGYRQIAIAGVDLYDRRYFYLNDNETRGTDQRRGKAYSDIHNTVDILDQLPGICGVFGSVLRVYNVNKRSLLTEVVGYKSIFDIIENRA